MSVELDPSVIFSKDVEQKEQIDYDSDINLYQDSDTYQLYDTDDYDQKLYSSSEEYPLELAGDNLESLYEEPVLYNEINDNEAQAVDYLLYSLISIQFFVLIYLIYVFIKKKRRKNVAN